MINNIFPFFEDVDPIFLSDRVTMCSILWLVIILHIQIEGYLKSAHDSTTFHFYWIVFLLMVGELSGPNLYGTFLNKQHLIWYISYLTKKFSVFEFLENLHHEHLVNIVIPIIVFCKMSA